MISLFFLTELIALVHSLHSLYIRKRKTNSKLVQPVQLKRSSHCCLITCVKNLLFFYTYKDNRMNHRDINLMH